MNPKIIKGRVRSLLLLAPTVLLFTSCDFIQDITKDWTNGEASFIPTPIEVVDRMLELAQVSKNDVVYDLGSGDGRIVIKAAKEYGARGVGIEIDPKLVKQSRAKAKEDGVSHLVEFRVQDAMKVDVSDATVVTLYLTSEFNSKLRPILEKQLRPGARVVSHDHETKGWTPDKVETMPGGLLHTHRIYLWRIKGRANPETSRQTAVHDGPPDLERDPYALATGNKTEKGNTQIKAPVEIVNPEPS